MALAPLVTRARRAHPWFAALPAATPAGAPYMGDVNGGPIKPTVELYLGPALGWVDVTSYVLYRDRIQISRGLPNQSTTTPPQTCALTISNRDGSFSPRNATGQFYGYVQRNTPMRVSRWFNGTQKYRFAGEVPEWPTDWDTTETDIYAQLQAAGILRRYNNANPTIGSAMYRWYTLQSAATAPLAYWPCEDGQYATTLASGLSGGVPLAVSGVPTLASDSSFPCSDAVPVVNGSTWIGGVPASASPQTCGLNFLVDIPSGGDTDGAIIASMFTSGTIARLDLVYNVASGGTLTMNGYSAAGTLLVTANSIGMTGAGYTGQLMLIQMNVTPSTVPVGMSAGVGIWSANATTLVVESNGAFGQTLSGGTLGQVTTVVINPLGAAGLITSSVGHVAAYGVNSVGPYYIASSAYYNPPFTAWNGENPYDRFVRLCLEQGVSGVLQEAGQSETVNGVKMGYQVDDTFTDLIQQIFDADFGLLYEAADQLGVAARSRQSLYNQTTSYNSGRPVLALDYAQGQLARVPKPADDDLFTQNDVTATRTNGGSARVTLTSGPMSTQSPPFGVGDYPASPPVNVATDSLLPDQAGWRVHMGTVNEPRYPVVAVNLFRASALGLTSLIQQALAVDIGDLITIANPPGSLLGADPIRAVIVGYTETMGIWEHDIVFNTMPASPYSVGIMEDPVLGHADTDGSTLATAVSATATSMSFATTAAATGSALWTTDFASFPYDLAIGGERVTVVGPGATLGPDPFLAQGLAQYNAQNCSITLDATAQWPVNTTHGVNPYAAATIKVVATGGFTVADIVTNNSAAGTVTPTVSYTAWVWVYSTSGRSLQVFINWSLNGVYASTSAASGVAPAAGTWTLLTVVATAPASVNEMSIGVEDGGSPAAGATFWVWGVNGAATAGAQSSPQSYTVIRSVNGVAKSQTAGTDVRLWQPMILGL